MKIAYLLDTDWVIDHFSKVAKVTQKLKELRPQGIALSIVSVAELYEGVIYSRNPSKDEKALRKLLKKFPVLGVNQGVCRIFGKERGRLRREGKIIADFDLLIASICLHYGLTLLSNNRRH